MTDVQYGPEASSVYDLLLSDPIPAETTIDALRALVSGKDVLELGVGTGRIARPLAPLVRSLVGVDNSPDMLAVFRAKGVPDNVRLIEADFRAPLPLPRFDVVYSTLGSLACCRDRDQLAAAFTNAAAHVRPGGVLCLEYYSAATYRQLLPVSPFAARTPQDHPFEITLTVDDERGVLTSTTSVLVDAEPVTFTEEILLLDPQEVREHLSRAGFEIADYRGEPGAAFDWYTARLVAT